VVATGGQFESFFMSFKYLSSRNKWDTSGIFLWTEFGFLHLVTRISTCNIVYHEDCHDWSCVSFTFVSELENLFEFGAYDIEYELDTGVLG
jgi:hypothetical protein